MARTITGMDCMPIPSVDTVLSRAIQIVREMDPDARRMQVERVKAAQMDYVPKDRTTIELAPCLMGIR